MASIKFTLIVITALVVIMALDEVHGLKCMHCGGPFESACSKDKENHGVSKECPNLGPMKCWKTNKDGEVWIRNCGANGENGCEGESNAKICICDTDDCNGAGGLHGWTCIQIFIFSLIVLFAPPLVPFIGGQ